MGKEVVLFQSEEKKSLADVAAFLHQLADKIAQGQVILLQGEEEVALDLPNNVVLELKAEEEAKKNKTQRSLEVEIEWIVGDDSGGSVTLG
jgi:amphi-Trp domain-containing protein